MCQKVRGRIGPKEAGLVGTLGKVDMVARLQIVVLVAVDAEHGTLVSLELQRHHRS